MPEGLTLDPNTGEISGTATETLEATPFEITAALPDNTKKTVEITIEIFPHRFSYPKIEGEMGLEIAAAAPRWVGSEPENPVYAVALPRGLALDPANGMITGIPTASASGSYGVTATYGQDSGVTSVSVVVIEILARDVPPGPPVLDSVDPKDKTATVSWTAPEAKGYLGKTEAEGVITGYRVYYAKGAGPTKTSFSRLIPGETAVSADISGLTNGGGYFFAVAAVTDAGEGELSNALEAAAAKPGKLARPSVVPVPGNGEVRVSWLPPRAETAASMPDPEKYAIYYAKGAAPVKDDGNTTKIEITDFTTLASVVSLAEGSYYFAVTAINSVGEGDLSDATEAKLGDAGPPDSVPAAPWNVEAVAGNGAITVTWADPADTGIFNGAKADITEFKVYYSENTIDDNTDLSQLSSEQFASLDQARSVEVSGLTNLHDLLHRRSSGQSRGRGRSIEFGEFYADCGKRASRGPRPGSGCCRRWKGYRKLEGPLRSWIF